MYVRLRRSFTFWSASAGLQRLKDFPAGSYGRVVVSGTRFQVHIFDEAEQHHYVCTPDMVMFDDCVVRLTPLEALLAGALLPEAE